MYTIKIGRFWFLFCSVRKVGEVAATSPGHDHKNFRLSADLWTYIGICGSAKAQSRQSLSYVHMVHMTTIASGFDPQQNEQTLKLSPSSEQTHQCLCQLVEIDVSVIKQVSVRPPDLPFFYLQVASFFM